MPRPATPVVCLALVALLVMGGASAGQATAARSDLRVRAASAARQVALGVATPDGHSLAALDRFSDSIGRRPAIWVVWSDWGLPSTRGFPTTMANGLAARGVVPMIWWEPIDPRALGSPTYARYRNIVDGRHDEYIRQFARDARAFGQTVLLRFAQEANGREFPWGLDRFDNDAGSYIAAWRHIHDIFSSVGATNVRFVWSVAKRGCNGCNPYEAIYPGDAYVDVVGLSAYNWGSSKRWISLYQSAARATRLLREVAAKPIILAESGSSPSGGDKAAWIRDGYPEVYARLPAIEAIVYLNADMRPAGHPDWRLGSPRTALTAYKEVAATTEFKGRSVP